MVSERAAAQNEVVGRVYYYHNDHLMTPVFMTASNGWAVWTLAQGPFEDYLVNTDHDGDGVHVYNPFRFPGQYSDPETNDMFWYNWNRWYMPELGRYAQADITGVHSFSKYFKNSKFNKTNFFLSRYGLNFANTFSYSINNGCHHASFGLMTLFKTIIAT